MSKASEIAELSARIEDLDRELERVRGRRRGTEWEWSRRREREQLRRRLEDLEGIDPIPSYNPAADPLYAGLWDDPAGRPAGDRRGAGPSQEDLAAAAEMSARGEFRPRAHAKS